MDIDMTDAANDDALAEAYVLAAEKMVEGGTVPEIRILLMGKGIGHEEATRIIAEVTEARSEVANEKAEQLMKSGAFWCVGGYLLTELTKTLAEGNGGTHLIFWGAMLYGALQFLDGLIQSKRRS